MSDTLFRITVARFDGKFTRDMREHVEETLKRARGTDVLVIDLNNADFEDASSLRFVRDDYCTQVTKPQVRILNGGDALKCGRISERDRERVQMLSGTRCLCPGNIPGVFWEDVVLHAADVRAASTSDGKQRLTELVPAIDANVRLLLPSARAEHDGESLWQWKNESRHVQIQPGAAAGVVEIFEDGSYVAVRSMSIRDSTPREIAMGIVEFLTA